MGEQAALKECVNRWMNECMSELPLEPEREEELELHSGWVGTPWGTEPPHPRGPHAATWPLAIRTCGVPPFVSEQGLQSSLLGLQMNGTRPGMASTKLSPWDTSSHSVQRVDLSAV